VVASNAVPSPSIAVARIGIYNGVISRSPTSSCNSKGSGNGSGWASRGSLLDDVSQKGRIVSFAIQRLVSKYLKGEV